jgi:hypothetical protein
MRKGAVLLSANPIRSGSAPGTGLCGYATEVDVGPPAIYAWLEATTDAFGFMQETSALLPGVRYTHTRTELMPWPRRSWEPCPEPCPQLCKSDPSKLDPTGRTRAKSTKKPLQMGHS